MPATNSALRRRAAGSSLGCKPQDLWRPVSSHGGRPRPVRGDSGGRYAPVPQSSLVCNAMGIAPGGGALASPAGPVHPQQAVPFDRAVEPFGWNRDNTPRRRHNTAPLRHGLSSRRHALGSFRHVVSSCCHRLSSRRPNSSPLRHFVSPCRHGASSCCHFLSRHRDNIFSLRHFSRSLRHDVSTCCHVFSSLRHAVSPRCRDVSLCRHSVGTFRHGIPPLRHDLSTLCRRMSWCCDGFPGSRRNPTVEAFPIAGQGSERRGKLLKTAARF